MYLPILCRRQTTKFKSHKSQNFVIWICPTDIDILTQQLEVEIFGWEDDIDPKTIEGFLHRGGLGF